MTLVNTQKVNLRSSQVNTSAVSMKHGNGFPIKLFNIFIKTLLFMSYSSKSILNNIKSPVLDEDVKFSKVVSEGRELLENKEEFQTHDWDWTRDLDDGGIFIFCYLLHDYRQKTLTLIHLKESVYTLNLLRHKTLLSREEKRLPLLGKFQLIFTLYERLKREEMSWDDCEEYINEQIAEHRETN